MGVFTLSRTFWDISGKGCWYCEELARSGADVNHSILDTGGSNTKNPIATFVVQGLSVQFLRLVEFSLCEIARQPSRRADIR